MRKLLAGVPDDTPLAVAGWFGEALGINGAYVSEMPVADRPFWHGTQLPPSRLVVVIEVPDRGPEPH